MNKKFGIIQSRGLGDIILAVPIAGNYKDQGYDIYWPICEDFISSVEKAIPWINWIPIPTDPLGDFFYNRPIAEFENRGIEEYICLYQSLSSHPEFSKENWFQIQKFDEYKYTKANVPFIKKWSLSTYIFRDHVSEKKLKDSLVKGDKYYVTHLVGSNWKAEPDLSAIPTEWQRIDITKGITDNIWDWLSILEGAEAIIAIDSVIANIVDQLQIDGPEKYWIPRSHIHLTPVLGSAWTILEPPAGSGASQLIFASSK